jgi:hypothetical protein
MTPRRNSDNSLLNKFHRLYFSRLYRINRKLFYLVVSFVFATIVCNLLGYEATPFFVWGMYSQKEAEPRFYEVQQVVINDSKTVDITKGYTPSTRFLLNSPLWYYMDIKKNSGIDPTISFLQAKLKDRYSLIKQYEHVLFNDTSRIAAFMPWYSRYAQEVTNTNVHNLKILNTRVFYLDEKIIEDTSYVFERWDQ